MTNSENPKKDKFKKGACMWTKRYPAQPGYAKQEYYYTVKLVDGTFLNFRRNPRKRVGDYQPDYVEFEPKDSAT